MSSPLRNARNFKPTLGRVAVLFTLVALALRLASSLALCGLLHWATWAVWQAARLPILLTHQDILLACLPNLATFWALASKMASGIGAILWFGAQ